MGLKSPRFSPVRLRLILDVNNYWISLKPWKVAYGASFFVSTEEPQVARLMDEHVLC
jgi:hypothetical protein